MLRVFPLILILIGLSLSTKASEQPEFKVVYLNSAPMAFEKEGKALGLQVEIVEYCLKKLGIKAKHEFYPWARAQKLLEEGEADLLISTPTDERFQYAIFGKEKVLYSSWSLYTHSVNKELIAKAKKFTKMEELKPYALVDYIGNGWGDRYLKPAEGYSVSKVTGLDQIPTMLLTKRGDFSFIGQTTMNWILKEKKLESDITEIETTIPNTKLHAIFIVSKKSSWVSKGIVKALDQTLVEMKKSGRWAKLMKYYGANPDESKYKSATDVEKYYLDYKKYPEFKK